MSDLSQSQKPQPPLGPGAPAQVEMLGENDLALTKNGKRFVFRCLPGEEADLLNRIAQMVSEPGCELTWFDAAVLSHQLGERMSKRIDEIASRRKSA